MLEVRHQSKHCTWQEPLILFFTGLEKPRHCPVDDGLLIIYSGVDLLDQTLSDKILRGRDIGGYELLVLDYEELTDG